jgi:hypothetical protein
MIDATPDAVDAGLDENFFEIAPETEAAAQLT